MRIVRYFPNTDLRCAQLGLSVIAHDAGIETRNIPVGEFLLFVNAKQTMFKMLTQNNVLVSYRTQSGAKLNPGIFVLIPKYFSGKEINYSGALREAMLRDFPKVNKGIKTLKELSKFEELSP